MVESGEKKYKKGDRVIVVDKKGRRSAEVLSFIKSPDGHYYMVRYVDRVQEDELYDCVPERQIIDDNKV